MAKHISIAGQRFGKLVAVERVENRGKKICYLCRCDCGNSSVVTVSNLRSGHTTSCGCNVIKHGRARKERLYNIWVGMRQRCRDKNSPDYPNYGGRGISVCPEWQQDYLSFRTWALASGYRDDLTIDRIDNDGDYTPENCRWVSLKVQNNNQSHNTRVVFNGKNHTLAEWAEIMDIPYRLLLSRLRNGWSFERIYRTAKGEAV